MGDFRERGRPARALAAADWGSGLSPLAQGRVHEDHLTHLLFVQSGGAMCAFRPVADSIGLDMLVRTAEEDRALGVQVKGAFVDGERSAIHVHVSEATFRPDADRFLVALGFIPRDLRPVPCVWVIRMDEVERMAEPHGGYYQLALDPVRGDDFAPWRFPLDEAARPFEAALRVLKSAGRGVALPTGREAVARVLGARP